MLALLLMALATLGSSWSGYQAALWDGIQTFLLMDAASQSRDADEKALTANGQRAVDGALSMPETYMKAEGYWPNSSWPACAPSSSRRSKLGWPRSR